MKDMMHSCQYCKIFYEVKEVHRRVESRNGKKFYYRRCNKIGQEVQSFDPPCDDFIPSKYIYCDKDHNWMFLVACLNKVNDCSCPQREALLDALRGHDIGELFNMRPILIKKKKPKKRPKQVIKLKKKKLVPRKVIKLRKRAGK